MAATSTVVWFRRDLRVDDHPALAAAAARGPVVCLFVVDPGILGRSHHRAPTRLRFLRAGLEALDRELARLGGRLVVRGGRPERVLPRVAAECGARRVAVTRETSPLGRARDRRVQAALAAEGIELAEHGGALIAEPEALAGSSGSGYLVFTPFFRAWSALPLPERVPPPARLHGPALPSKGFGRLPGGDPLLPAGPGAGRERLLAFIRSGDVDAYGERRDALAEDGTSRLSPYLRLGMLGPAEVARALGPEPAAGGGRRELLRQLAWREFFHHLLARRPEVAREALRPALRAIRWDGDPGHVRAWVRGETGYPIVDAAMRQLDELGWVHNRARLVASSFLVKDLLVDWRVGEGHYMRSLIDGDPASNNGGWQWSAGTGADAAPYFRVMSPTRQADRFDPDGAYVRRFLPELRDVPAERIHEPWRMSPEEQRAAGVRIGRDYPAPIVDHRERRAIAIERYRAAAALSRDGGASP